MVCLFFLFYPCFISTLPRENPPGKGNKLQQTKGRLEERRTKSHGRKVEVCRCDVHEHVLAAGLLDVIIAVLWATFVCFLEVGVLHWWFFLFFCGGGTCIVLCFSFLVVGSKFAMKFEWFLLAPCGLYLVVSSIGVVLCYIFLGFSTVFPIRFLLLIDRPAILLDPEGPFG